MRTLSPNAQLRDVIASLREVAQEIDSLRAGKFSIRSDVDFGGKRIRNLGKPVDSGDAQTKIRDLSGEFAPIGASYVVAGNLDITLTHERLLAAGDGIEVTDNGAGSTVVVSADQAFFDALYQPLDAQLTSLAGLSYTGNTLKVIRVNAGETAFELVTPASIGVHDAVTMSGTPDYITLSGQDIVRGLIDQTTDVTGTLPIGNGGTGNTSGTAEKVNPASAGLDTIMHIALLGGTSSSEAVRYHAGSGILSYNAVTRDLVHDGKLRLGFITAPTEALDVTGNALISGTLGVTGLITGSISGNAGTVTTNANLTGPITSVGNATTVADAELAALAGLTSAADSFPYFTGSGTAALLVVPSAVRTFLATPSSANLASALSDEAFSMSDAELGALAGLTSAADKIPRFTGSGTADLLDFKDEDNMASDSATALPSQQSVKAYADTYGPVEFMVASVGNYGTTKNYLGVHGVQGQSTAVGARKIYIPTARTITNFAVTISSVTDAGTGTATFALENITAGTSTTLTLAEGVGTTNSASGLTFAIAAGDFVTFSIVTATGSMGTRNIQLTAWGKRT